MNRKTRQVDLWAICNECRDQFSISVWIRPTEEENVWKGRIEHSSDLKPVEGRLIPLHRCGGELKVYGNGMKIALER